MPKIATSVSIACAHFVHTTKTKCLNLHGHNWKFEIELEGSVGPDGMIVDFNDIKALLEPLDHKTLLPNSEFVEIQEYKNKYYKIKVYDWIDATDPKVPINATEQPPKLLKEYMLPIAECVVLKISEITAENLASLICDWCTLNFNIKAKVKVWESEKSWAEWSSD